MSIAGVEILQPPDPTALPGEFDFLASPCLSRLLWRRDANRGLRPDEKKRIRIVLLADKQDGMQRIRARGNLGKPIRW
jgi:hypothetical protein